MTPTREQVARFKRFKRTDNWDDWHPDHDIWPSRGGQAIKWMTTFLIHGPGPVQGRPLSFRQDQQEWLYRWFEYSPQTGLWRYVKALKGEARGGAKTEIAAGLGCLELAGPKELRSDHSDVPDIAMCATSWEQVGLLFGCAQVMLGGQGDTVPDAPLAGQFHVQDGQIIWRDGRPGRIYRVAAVAGSNEGGRPSLVLFDELHELTGNKERVHTVLTTGLTKRKPMGREVNITTAGAGRGAIPPRETDSLCWKLYAAGLAQEHDGQRTRFLFDWRAADEGLDPENDEDVLAGIRQASGAADVVWSATDRLERWKDPTIPRHENLRYLWNRWVTVSTDSWLSDHPGAWSACEHTGLVIPDGAEVVIGVDAALRRDLFAVVTAWRMPDGKHAWKARAWSAASGGFIDHQDPFDHIVAEARKFKVLEVVYDPRLFELEARRLSEDHGIATTEVPQSTVRRSQMDERAYELIVTRQIAHDGDPMLAEHVHNAAWRLSENRRVLSKGKSGGHIDAVIAGAMASWHLDIQEPEPEPRREPQLLVL